MAHKTNQLIAKFKRSHLTRKEFCKRQGIPLATLAYHITKANRASGSKLQVKKSSFIPIKLPSQQSSASHKPVSRLAVVLHGHYSIEEVANLVTSLVQS